MASWLTRSEGRFSVHVLPTSQFRTRYMSLKLELPMQRESVTGTALLPYLWLEGTTQHPTAIDLTRYTDELFGASVRTFIQKRADRHVLEVQGSAPELGTVDQAAQVIQQMESLLLEIATDPLLGHNGFLPEHVERERHLHDQRIQSVYDDKITYAMDRCLEAMAGDTPLALPRLGFREDIAQWNGDNLWKLHQQIVAGANVHFYTVGQIQDPESVTANILHVLHQQFGAGARSSVAKTPVRAFTRRRTDVQELAERQPVQQAKLNLAYETGVSYGDSDYVPLLIANGILGGFPHSKLFMNVREKASLAYYASSRLDGLTGIVAVQTGIEMENQTRAMDIIRNQVQILKNGEVTDDEFDFTVRGLTNQYQQALDQPVSLAEIHFSGVLAGISRDLESLIKSIGQVTKEQAIAAAQHLSLDTVYLLSGEERANSAVHE